ncbi:MAG: hypothetical protein COA69_11555 [Robiginitomaculum sp.]|nr:MAG: hypothetical protein COA69_11555 [Robiginitomaculum sp.]
MVNFQDLPTRMVIKAQAKRLRAKLRADGTPISHSKTLEMLAHQHGFKDWNSFNATLQKQATPFIVPNGYHVGDRVQGRYLGQFFRGHIHGVEAIGSDHMRLTLDFDEPVDVVTFDSFSAFRKRVQCVIGPKGQSPQKTSNGEPQLCLGKA